MRSLKECFRYEVRQPDGSWVQAHIEQIDVGDVARMVRQDGEVVSFPHAKTGEPTTLMTFISQGVFSAVHGDFQEEVMMELKKRTTLLPGEPSPLQNTEIVPPTSLKQQPH